MTFEKATAILTAHNIRTRQNGSELQAFEVGTLNGLPCNRWVTVKLTVSWLHEFLNY